MRFHLAVIPVLLLACFAALAVLPAGAQPLDAVQALREEVAGKGWIVFSARSRNGSWDLFLMRPDGSERRALTNTPEVEEAAPRFSPDGSKLLWRAMRRGTVINHDQWGTQGHLVIADANGQNPRPLGKDGMHPWASWSPDGRQLSCLTREGIVIIDAETGERVRTMPRQGLFQQLFWSPDGQWFTGVANYMGTSWTVVRVHAETGEMNAVRRFQNCTPDWFPDSERLIFSSRPPEQRANKGYGWTFLWMANGGGEPSRLVYGEEGYHLYGGLVSPCGTYVMFTRSGVDGGGSERDGAPMSIVRLADTPMIRGETPELRPQYPSATSGPMLTLGDGWEPHWTFAEIRLE